MTRTQRITSASAPASTAQERAAAGADHEPPSGPVVILTYAHAGVETLTSMLSASRSLACTSGTGLLPLCQVALSTWQSVENGARSPSAMAIKSVRALASTLASVVQAGAGASRWCETAFAGQLAAGTFLRVFPATTFLCLHRGLPAVVADGRSAYPWGLGSSPFWPYSGGHPGNNLATMAAYWASNTEMLLDFEAEHPRSCLRIRNEDLTEDLRGQASSIYARLGLDVGDLAGSGLPAEPHAATGAAITSGPRVPWEQIPPLLLAKVCDLHVKLGYCALA